MNAEQVIERMIALFDSHAEYFGLSDDQFPDHQPQNRQCDFEDQFKALVCEYKGHDIGPDQCGKPEHDFCYRCHKLKTVIEQEACA